MIPSRLSGLANELLSNERAPYLNNVIKWRSIGIEVYVKVGDGTLAHTVKIFGSEVIPFNHLEKKSPEH